MSRSHHNSDAIVADPSPASGKVCVIGAGSSGLAVAKNFKQLGIDFDCFEREDDVGGNWFFGKPGSSVCRSTHLISSKKLTEYTDFPMPEAFPEFPSHEQAWEYLRSYARHFGLYETIEFNTAVKWIDRIGIGAWSVTLASGETRAYSEVVIANGHNWDPRWPDYPGHFDGDLLHSAQYKTPDPIADRRALVVGGGNSGCDIAAECAHHARFACLSLRRGYHYLPKFFHGTPIDICGERMLRWGFPLWLRRLLAAGGAFLSLGSLQSAGLPKPDHRLFETHPIINSQVIYHVRHGDLTIKPDIVRLEGDLVHFADGSSESFDVIVYATGYKITIPFIDRDELHWRDDRPELYLNLFHPERDDLFIAGLIQPDSGQWGLVDYQAQCVAHYLRGLRQGSASARRLQKRKRTPNAHDRGAGVRYVRSPRHLLEVEHFSYRRQLEKLIRQLKRS